VARFYKSCNKNPEDSVTTEDIDLYLKQLSKNCEEWQVKKVSDAINLHQFFKTRKSMTQGKEPLKISIQWKTVAEEMIKLLRLMHRSYRTEQSYIGWVRQFY
jgi:hypothetical protein